MKWIFVGGQVTQGTRIFTSAPITWRYNESEYSTSYLNLFKTKLITISWQHIFNNSSLIWKNSRVVALVFCNHNCLSAVDWQVGVFGLYDIVDRPSDHISVCNIPLSGYMYIHSCCIPFSYQSLMYIWYDSHRRHNHLNNYPLMVYPTRDQQCPELFHTTELPGASPRPKHYPIMKSLS